MDQVVGPDQRGGGFEVVVEPAVLPERTVVGGLFALSRALGLVPRLPVVEWPLADYFRETEQDHRGLVRVLLLSRLAIASRQAIDHVLDLDVLATEATVLVYPAPQLLPELLPWVRRALRVIIPMHARLPTGQIRTHLALGAHPGTAGHVPADEPPHARVWPRVGNVGWRARRPFSTGDLLWGYG